MRKGTLKEIQKVTVDVLGLIDKAITEIDEQRRYDNVNGAIVRVHPLGAAPDDARHPLYTLTSSALRRRSMDLTRLLAEMRRAER